jgi:hypothetical protein
VKGRLGRAILASRDDPRAWVLALLAVAIAVGCTWGLPGSHAWAADAISPRSCGLGAVVETYAPGRFHAYPPLHMAILTVTSAPWIAIAAARVGTSPGALVDELVKPFYMTGIEIGARAVAAAMALGAVWNTMRLWSRLAGRGAAAWAGLFVALDGVFVYYAHTGNLDVPALFWVTWALVEVDRVAAGQPREAQALLAAMAAALTKDQAAGALVVPLVVLVAIAPRVYDGAPPLRPRLLRAAGLALGAYALASGAIVNPSGFRARIDFLFGPASKTWAQYPSGLDGALALARDAALAIPHFSSWALAAAAFAGVLVVTRDRRGRERLRALSPAMAAASFGLLFNLGARRTEDRFLLPHAVLLAPYAAVTLRYAWRRAPRARRAIAALAAVAIAPAALRVASVDATLLADARYEVERYLAGLPFTHRVEIYGGPIFLPRVPPHLAPVRPGVEPVSERQVIPGVKELVDPIMDPRPRSPDVIVLATELSVLGMADPAAGHPHGLMSYRDPVSRAFLGRLFDGSLGYTRALRATCEVPPPLECVKIHASTGAEAWVYERH